MGRVVVYHGTAMDIAEEITRNGLIPRRSSGYSYVTTDRSVAEKYAWAWTGGRLYEADKLMEQGEHVFVSEEGAVIAFEIDTVSLEVDDYNLEKEPNQFKVLGGISRESIQRVDEVVFDCFVSESDGYRSETLKARCFLVGVTRE